MSCFPTESTVHGQKKQVSWLEIILQASTFPIAQWWSWSFRPSYSSGGCCGIAPHSLL